jgi:inosine/xanthosine triphosphate pyrophosphatase family protein
MKNNQDFIFVSGNMNKVRMLEKFLSREVVHHNLDLDEIQSLDPEKVVEHKVKEAYCAKNE